MPKPKTRKPTASKNPIQEVLERGRVLDRRRQAQIANQIGTINRLLERFDTVTDGLQSGVVLSVPTSQAVYSEEMETLHMAAATLQVENSDLREAVRDLVVAIDGTPLDGVSWGTGKDGRDALAAALEQARAIVGLSAPVTPQEAPAGE